MEAIGTAFTEENIEPGRCRGGGSHIPLYSLIWSLQKMDRLWRKCHDRDN